MKIFSECQTIRKQIHLYQAQKETIALVPTMGHLHRGHVSLIELAKTKASRVIVSIFVNPIQFNQASDFNRYPRTLEDDINTLRELNIDALFIPEQDELYPHGIEQIPKITIPELSEIFEGQFRPSHFDGVCTVVSKLFNIITPDIALFGEKDYQQLLIIQRMTDDLNFNIRIVPGKTQRESNGLAMSSRNSHLTSEQREQAAQIYSILRHTKDQFSIKNIPQLEVDASSLLEQHGFNIEYFSIRDSSNLQPVSQHTESIVVLVAAWLGETRLIDNILFPAP